jgi:hypothetical protein
MKKTHNYFQKGGSRTTFISVVVLLILIAGIILITRNSNTQPQPLPGPDTTVSDPIPEYEYQVTLKNTSSDQTLSPGLYIAHTDDFSLDYEGSLSPSELESLAEYGDYESFGRLLENDETIAPEVLEIFVIDEPLLPGQSTMFTFLMNVEDAGILFSGIQMAIASNDGYVLIDSLELNGQDIQVEARNFDNGTEENAEIGSGFAGGQPDPTQDEANITNGTPTNPQEPVSLHSQLTEPILQVTLKLI